MKQADIYGKAFNGKFSIHMPWRLFPFLVMPGYGHCFIMFQRDSEGACFT